MTRTRILLITVLLFAVAPSWGATFTVNSTADVVDATPGDGVCETAKGNGVCTLRAAIQEAGALSGPNTIIVPAGFYALSATPPCTFNLAGNPVTQTENTSALCVRGDVTIQGADPNTTIIDAGGAGGATCCGSYPSARAIVTSSDTNGTISGFTIQNGLSNGGYTFFGGGGISNQGVLKLSNLIFTANTGIPFGGGIFNNGTLFVASTTFLANSAREGASGLYNAGGATATVTNSSFSSGQAGGSGGAIWNWGSLEISASTIDNNSAGQNGGGIYNDYGPLKLTNVTITANTSLGGSAIWNNQSGTVTAENVTFAFNHGTGRIGAVSNTGVFTMRNSVLGANSTDGGPPDCSAGPPITSQGHNLISDITNCALNGATAADIYGKDPVLGALAFNGGATQTLALLPGSPAIDAGDPGAAGGGANACAATDQRGVFRPQGGACDIGAFERGSGFSVSAVRPSHAGNLGSAQLLLSGSGLLSGASVSLHRGGQTDRAANAVTVEGGNSALSASFDLTGAATGSWDVVVGNPDGSVKTLPGAFTVEAAGQAQVWTEVVGPVVARPDGTSNYFLVYGNRGNVEALGVPVTLATPVLNPLTIHFRVEPPPAQPGQVTVDWSKTQLYVSTGVTTDTVNVPFLLPVIPPGYTGTLQFSLDVPSTSYHEGDSFTFGAQTADSYFNPTIDPSVVNTIVAGAQSYAQTNLNVTVPASKLSSVAQYTTNAFQNMVTNGKLALNATLGSKGQVYSPAQLAIDVAEFAAFGSPLAAAQIQAKSLLKSAAPANSGPPPCDNSGVLQEGGTSCQNDDSKIPIKDPKDNNGLTPWVCRSLPNHHVSIDGKMCVPDRKQPCGIFQNIFYSDPNCFRIPIKTSVDPNEKWGPVGPGVQQFRATLGTSTYDVEFENLATAALPAQTVVVTDQLDTTNLDLSTFSLGPISFGSYTFTPPPGLQKFTSGLDLSPQVNLQVKVEASLDASSGIATWKFTSLDPATGQATSDPTGGFLPPNIMPPQGDARVVYRIDPKPGFASGTTICNQAVVVFDTNAPIKTPNWCNTIDTTAPVSSVQSLPAREASPTFNVHWSGTDAGSGVLDYTIYVSDNGGTFSAWQTNLTATQANYTGVTGHTYSFFSIARDLLGNVEGPKSAAEATTLVGSTATCANDISSLIAITRSGFSFNPVTKAYAQTLTLKNTSSAAITGPISLVLDSLSSNTTLSNSSGATACATPFGSPYAAISTPLNPGASTSVLLRFSDPTKAAITYSTRVLAGSGKP